MSQVWLTPIFQIGLLKPGECRSLGSYTSLPRGPLGHPPALGTSGRQQRSPREMRLEALHPREPCPMRPGRPSCCQQTEKEGAGREDSTSPAPAAPRGKAGACLSRNAQHQTGRTCRGPQLARTLGPDRPEEGTCPPKRGGHRCTGWAREEGTAGAPENGFPISHPNISKGNTVATPQIHHVSSPSSRRGAAPDWLGERADAALQTSRATRQAVHFQTLVLS